MNESFLSTEHHGPVALIVLRRPEKLNALSSQVLAQLASTVEALESQESIRCVVHTGHGAAFVAGADIEEMRAFSASQAEEFSIQGQAVFRSIEESRLPYLAAVNGYALGGGCELALACDFIYASKKAKFGQPEARLGLIPGFGGTQRLPRRIGIAAARELIMTARSIDADEALRLGLVNRVIEPDALLDTALACGREIAGNGPAAISVAKRTLLKGVYPLLDQALELESRSFGRCFDGVEYQEGVAAFLGKRPPNFG
ncbi:MAG: enoyl-CoA hydratase-related protein [Myxococcota bacterium]